ncbi:hypothetical protein AGDE_15803 [Angomonas deanei]|uniref:Uncharacterized protein n=1 Tax=Angomonas deanei TaxID=59799 RepID=A0A7G2CCY5_9TRYP|nr:hypothetical protein AGDE_15803 [Angomonas deanei]CAD2216871.1 hypothetical protein, conserved [Angomonas deanei]|eukprot:EPY18388.1 hypothetical protein AGDE_15803 [Angomonas deanei]
MEEKDHHNTSNHNNHNNNSGHHYSVEWGIRNAIVMPVGKFGCVVVADKRLSLSQDEHRPAALQNMNEYFSLLDEHSAWGVSHLLHALLRRYDKSVLIENTYAPMTACFQSLDRIALLNTISALRSEALKEASKAQEAKKSTDKKAMFASDEANHVYELISGGKNFTDYYQSMTTATNSNKNASGNKVLSTVQKNLIEEAQHKDHMALLNHKLKIIRASDESTRRLADSHHTNSALPKQEATHDVHQLSTMTQISRDLQQLSNINNTNVKLHPVSTLATLTEEEVFQEAASYLTQLEQLWGEAVSSKNNIQGRMTKFSNDVEQSRITISDLETKLKKANVRIEKLENLQRKNEKKQQQQQRQPQ